MRALGGLLVLAVLVSAPLTMACYEPRLQACRDPMTDFSSITDVTVTNAVFGASAGEGGVWPASYTITAHVSGTARTQCVAIHSELRNGSTVVETIDTPIRAQSAGNTITTTPVFHYHSAGIAPTVHVVVFGQTLDAPFVRSGTTFPDAGVRGDAAP